MHDAINKVQQQAQLFHGFDPRARENGARLGTEQTCKTLGVTWVYVRIKAECSFQNGTPPPILNTVLRVTGLVTVPKEMEWNPLSPRL